VVSLVLLSVVVAVAFVVVFSVVVSIAGAAGRVEDGTPQYPPY